MVALGSIPRSSDLPCRHVRPVSASCATRVKTSSEHNCVVFTKVHVKHLRIILFKCATAGLNDQPAPVAIEIRLVVDTCPSLVVRNRSHFNGLSGLKRSAWRATRSSCQLPHQLRIRLWRNCRRECWTVVCQRRWIDRIKRHEVILLQGRD